MNSNFISTARRHWRHFSQATAWLAATFAATQHLTAQQPQYSVPAPGPYGYGPPQSYVVPQPGMYGMPAPGGQPGPMQGAAAAPVMSVSDGADLPTAEGAAKAHEFIADIQEPDVVMELKTQKSKLVRTRLPVVRVAIADPGIVEIVNFNTNEFELIGRTAGETTMTLWFAGAKPGEYAPNLRYLIKVRRDEQDERQARIEYGELQKRINELFPDSFVQLIPVADKLIVRGQARDAREASQIMSMIRGNAVDQSGAMLGPGSYLGFGFGNNGGIAARIPGAEDLPAASVINMMMVPGEQQVMLKVRIAELKRAALRDMGADFSFQAGDFSFASALTVNGAFQAVLSSADVQLALSALSSNNMTKVLAEPNLVTLSGYPATFIAGGQFAVPTVVGVGGVQAATTQFQGYGTQIFFTPTVMDKDHIRLQVTPTFSTLNTGTSVNGIFGLDTRSVSTTVDLREGQWLAIAGLLQDQQAGSKARVPWLGDIPVIDILFSKKHSTRDENELVVLVSPELVNPMEPDQVPLILPGMEVTEPDDWAFFIRGRYEGNPAKNHRSTVWPIYQYGAQDAKCQAIMQAKQNSHYMRSERFYMNGPCGFTN